MLPQIIIIDYGSQYTQLIARKIREQNIYTEIYPYNALPRNLKKNTNLKGIILSGGPNSVYEVNAPDIPEIIFSLNLPILGICYGLQILCHQLGGKVIECQKREYGQAKVKMTLEHQFLPEKWAVGCERSVWMSHGDSISDLPDNFVSIASSEHTPHVIIANDNERIYGIQFHPEVHHTYEGNLLLNQFVLNICGCIADWTMENFYEEQIELIRKTAGQDKVICALSGGVDSSVVATLLHHAIGDQLVCVFVDHGLLRQNEAEEVEAAFRDHLNINLNTIKAEDRFLELLKGISEPEKKRKIIGNQFIKEFEKEAQKYQGIKFLAQGTLYPDVIESVSFNGAPSHTIKTHHNVGGLPKKLDFKLIEPLRELFKDEVRQLGAFMGIPDYILKRHPFPGPGLAIRILGDITKDKCKTLRLADAIFREEIKNFGLHDEIWQSLAVLLPVNSVGVMGDKRTYENVCALRAVTSVDGMTADIYDFSGEFLRKVSTRIVNEVKGINRVVYDISTKPPATIEWE